MTKSYVPALVCKQGTSVDRYYNQLSHAHNNLVQKNYIQGLNPLSRLAIIISSGEATIEHK